MLHVLCVCVCAVSGACVRACDVFIVCVSICSITYVPCLLLTCDGIEKYVHSPVKHLALLNLTAYTYIPCLLLTCDGIEKYVLQCPVKHGDCSM